MGLMALFIHLKIILLQCFQFSILAKKVLSKRTLSISMVFLSRFLFFFFSYEKPLFISNSIAFDLEFSLGMYWELITNFEFKFKLKFEFNLFFHLIRNFHVSFFFFFFFLTLLHGFLHLMLPCGLDMCHFYVSHDNSKIWHVAWFHLLIVHCWQVIKCKLIWSWSVKQ